MNRRKGARERLWLPVYSQELAGGAGVTYDVSDKGMLLLSSAPLSTGSVVQLRFSIPPESGVDFAPTARVVRVSPNADDPDGIWKYQLAVTFEQELPDVVPLIAELKRR